MLKPLYLLLAVCLIISCQAPQQETETTPVISTITLSGKVENPKGKEIKIRQGEKNLSAALDENGTFAIDVSLEKAGLWSFSHGGERTSIYLQPEKDLSVTLNTNEFDESLKYEGEGATENNYLAARFLLDEKLWEDRKGIFSMEEAEFVEKTTAIRQQIAQQLTELSANLPEAFVADQKTEHLYDWAQNRISYKNYHRYFTNNKDFEPSEGYDDFMKEVNMADEQALKIGAYKSFWRSYADMKTKAAMEKLENPSAETRILTNMETIKTLFSNEKVRNAMLYATMNDVANYEGSKATDKIVETYSAMTTNQDDLTKIKDKLEPWSTLRAGLPAPDFKYAQIDGKPVALSELKGKNVYIDVWATWCGPCRRELPSLEALETKYKDNPNLVFASVSIDEDKEAWEKMVTEKEMMGLQLFADKAWDSKICKDYLIKGIPRFMLVGSDGKIIDVDAPRPSSDEIKAILAELAKPSVTSMK